jgi:hypothetical protein
MYVYNIYMYIYILYMSVYAHRYICVYVYMHICIYTYMHIFIEIYLCLGMEISFYLELTDVSARSRSEGAGANLCTGVVGTSKFEVFSGNSSTVLYSASCASVKVSVELSV